ncbi:hypothetical protein, partial [Plasmodium yoelii yoelii]
LNLKIFHHFLIMETVYGISSIIKNPLLVLLSKNEIPYISIISIFFFDCLHLLISYYF